jgi:hypothetical protein
MKTVHARAWMLKRQVPELPYCETHPRDEEDRERKMLTDMCDAIIRAGEGTPRASLFRVMTMVASRVLTPLLDDRQFEGMIEILRATRAVALAARNSEGDPA